jgi:putative heme-binding domain-containing protein
LKGLARGMKNRKTHFTLPDADQKLLVETFFNTSSDDLRQASLQVLKTSGIADSSLETSSVSHAVSIAGDPKQPDKKRADAIDFISIGDAAPHLVFLEKLLVPQEQPAVQLAAIRTINTIHSTAGTAYLIEHWPALTKEIREAAINVFVSDTARIALFVDAMEKNKILPSSVSFGTSVGLMQVANEKLRMRTRKLFTKSQQQAKTINKEYEAALNLKGDAVKGKEVYITNCAICHQQRGKIGVALGPDLGTIHNWKKEDILANILDPNLSILAGYDLWQVELNSGETLQGIIASETSSAFTLKNNGKMDRIISRQDVKSLKSLSISPMPAGLEKNISKEAMSNLLAFLKQH